MTGKQALEKIKNLTSEYGDSSIQQKYPIEINTIEEDLEMLSFLKKEIINQSKNKYGITRNGRDVWGWFEIDVEAFMEYYPDFKKWLLEDDN